MIHRIEIRPKEGFGNPHAEGVFSEIKELGIESVEGVRSARLFFLVGDLSADDARRVGEELLGDPVVEEFKLGDSEPDAKDRGGGAADPEAVIEVHLRPGVMDPVAASTEGAIRDMGLDVDSVCTGRRYELSGRISTPDRRIIATKLLANPVIEDVHYEAHTPPEVHGHSYELNVVELPICNLDDAGLEQLSKDREMFLNLTEMKAIQGYFRNLNREPRDVELEMIAQTWSEHCIHKTFRSDVCVRNNAGEVVEEIPNLLKSTVFGATKELDKPWCLSVFEDNAGVIEFDDDWAVCFKVETHNHPSAIEPYGGAATGIGGVIRDPMGTGLGARPVANTDVFCFGDTEMKLADVPTGVLHPRRVMRGVVAGVRDYGNRMGIPTVNGAVCFDERYVGNPLVFCGTVAMIPKGMCTKQWPTAGDAILCVGGRTGRDGIHGATFSSGELTHEHETEFSHAVQIGNAITEKKMLDCMLQARDAGLYTAITDCGAGGLSSAVGEMGQKIGAEVHLDRVPLKYAGLSYPEIWISEAQERMVLGVPQQNVKPILKIFADEGVEATVIGHYGCAKRVAQPPSAGNVAGEARPTSSQYRRNLPHIQKPGKTYFITFCTHKRCELPNNARDIVLHHCLFDHGKRYHLHGCVVMPDHVHLVLTPLQDKAGETYGLAEIMNGIKGASVHSINRLLGRKGKIWQDESFDHLLRSTESAQQKVEYLSGNPVRKGLVSSVDDYSWVWREGIEGREAEAGNSTAEGGYATRPVLRLFYDGVLVGDLDMEFLEDGLPRPTKDALWDPVQLASPKPEEKRSYNDTLLKILAAPNVASKEWIIRQYDHEVQGGSVIKPLVGVTEDGPGDAAVVRPLLSSEKGLAISCGLNPTLSDLDPYQGALHAVDEALRNIVAVGGNLDRTAILDNFCWGNCNKPDRMGALVQAAKAARHAAMAYGTPFVSGKDSLNNEFLTDSGETIAIPPTLLISAMSVLDDSRRCVTADAKKAGNRLFILGRTGGELGGSHYLKVEGLRSGNDVPPVNCAENLKTMLALQKGIETGLVRSCHDLSEGGLAVAAAEMAFAGGLGVRIDTSEIPLEIADGPLENADAPSAAKLFGESGGRFLVEIEPENKDAFTAIMDGIPYAEIGKVTDTARIVIGDLIDVSIVEAKKSWKGTFDW